MISAGDLELIAAETSELIRAVRGEIPAGEIVDFEQLFRVVPRTLADLPRVSREGQTHRIGIGFSGVEAVYEVHDESLTLEIYDLALYINLSDMLVYRMDTRRDGSDTSGIREDQAVPVCRQ